MTDLLTDEQQRRMLENGRREQREEAFDPEPVVKLVLPGLSMVWLLSSLDPEVPDYAFGLCDLGFGTPELGSVSLTGLAESTGPLAPKVRRDDLFKPVMPISAYAEAARAAQAIITD